MFDHAGAHGKSKSSLSHCHMQDKFLILPNIHSSMLLATEAELIACWRTSYQPLKTNKYCKFTFWEDLSKALSLVPSYHLYMRVFFPTLPL